MKNNKMLLPVISGSMITVTMIVMVMMIGLAPKTGADNGNIALMAGDTLRTRDCDMDMLQNMTRLFTRDRLGPFY